MRTRLIVLFGLLPVAAAAALLGGSWYYSDQLRKGALVPGDPPKLDLEVVALAEGRITLRPTSDAKRNGDWTQDGIFGLESAGGYDQVGKILEIDERQAVREFVPISGRIRVGDLARLDSFAFPSDPQQALGIPFEEVTYHSPLGDTPAWYIAGPRDTWTVFVHGKGASRREALRILPAIVGLGLPSLVITYRNDPEAPPSADELYRYGATEWEDLQAAVDYALDHGAKQIVLVGYSMGGAIVTNFLYQSPLAGRVAGVIFDSPMLDFGATVDHGVAQTKLPGVLSSVGKVIAGRRFDINWGELNYLKRAGRLSVPILLFHGDDDERVPVETSDALARARPDIVTYVRTAGVGHVRSWNADPEAYEAAVRGFLGRVAPSTN